MATYYPCYHVQLLGENQGNDWQHNSIYEIWYCSTTTDTGSDSIRSNNNAKESITNLFNYMLIKDATVQRQGDMM